MAKLKYLGEFLKTVSLINAQSISSATTVNGSGIDRLGYDHLVCHVNVGTMTGTSTTLDFKIQHATAIAGSYSDFTPNQIAPSNNQSNTTASIAQIAQASSPTVVKLDVDLAAANRYIRGVAITGGTVTAVPVGVGGFLTAISGLEPGGTA